MKAHAGKWYGSVELESTGISVPVVLHTTGAYIGKRTLWQDDKLEDWLQAPKSMIRNDDEGRFFPATELDNGLYEIDL